jgi:hypothetical protein
MPWPAFLLVEHRPDGIFLFRYTAEGEYAGDTWHQSHEEAIGQARFEYGDLVGDWLPVPPEVRDVVAFARHLRLGPQ